MQKKKQNYKHSTTRDQKKYKVVTSTLSCLLMCSFEWKQQNKQNFDNTVDFKQLESHLSIVKFYDFRHFNIILYVIYEKRNNQDKGF